MVGWPHEFGSDLYKTGDVFHGFQGEEEEGLGHALVKGDFLGTRGPEEREKGSTVLKRSGAGRGIPLAQEER